MSSVHRPNHHRHPKRGTERLVLAQPPNFWRSRLPVIAGLTLAAIVAAGLLLKG